MSLLSFWAGSAAFGALLICISTVLSFIFHGTSDEKDAHIACLVGLGLIFAPLSIPLLLLIGVIRSLYFTYKSVMKNIGE